jgi:gas vesicle protein
MNKVLKIMGGLVVGAMLGVGLVLLFAPRSGAETQQLIRDRIESILSEGQQAAETRRLELHAQFEALKRPEGQA